MLYALWCLGLIWLAAAPTPVAALPIDLVQLIRGLRTPPWGHQRPLQIPLPDDDEDWQERGWADPRVNGGQMLDVR